MTIEQCEQQHEKETFDSIGVYLCCECKRIFWQVPDCPSDGVGIEEAIMRVAEQIEPMIQNGWEVV